MGTARISKVNQFLFWVKKQPNNVKIILAALLIILVLLALVIVERTLYHEGYLFIASEVFHLAGLVVLIYKLKVHKSCAGLSLKSQELTALYLVSRLCGVGLYASSIKTLFYFLILAATAWVIYMIRFKLKSTYIKELDNFPRRCVIAPCAIFAALIHPFFFHPFFGIGWAFSCYLEAISVWPQLHLIKKAKVAEPFTAHYVFALGLSRFCQFAHSLIQFYYVEGIYLLKLGSTRLWYPAFFFAEVIQTFILADFCYYFTKSYMDGQLVMKMPS